MLVLKPAQKQRGWEQGWGVHINSAKYQVPRASLAVAYITASFGRAPSDQQR